MSTLPVEYEFRKPPQPKPKFANLPKRKCDNCGSSYRPNRPLREGFDKHGFCKPECKKQFHKHGTAFIQMRQAMEKEFKWRLQLERKCPECKGSGKGHGTIKKGLAINSSVIVYRPERHGDGNMDCRTCHGHGTEWGPRPGWIYTEFGKEVKQFIMELIEERLQEYPD